MEYSCNDHPGKYSLILYTSWCNFRFLVVIIDN